MADDYPWSSVDRNTDESMYSGYKTVLKGAGILGAVGIGAYLGAGENDIDISPEDVIMILEEDPQSVNSILEASIQAAQSSTELYSSLGL